MDVKAGVLPVPVRLTEMGLPNALYGIESVPVRTPTAVGWNFTPILHVSPAPTIPHVLLLMAKSPLAVAGKTVSDVLK